MILFILFFLLLIIIVLHCIVLYCFVIVKLFGPCILLVYAIVTVTGP